MTQNTKKSVFQDRFAGKHTHTIIEFKLYSHWCAHIDTDANPIRFGHEWRMEWIVFPLSTTQSIYLFPFIIRLRFPSPVQFKCVILLLGVRCTTTPNAISTSSIKMTSIDPLVITFKYIFWLHFSCFAMVECLSMQIGSHKSTRYDSKSSRPLHPIHSIRFCDLFFVSSLSAS